MSFWDSLELPWQEAFTQVSIAEVMNLLAITLEPKRVY